MMLKMPREVLKCQCPDCLGVRLNMMGSKESVHVVTFNWDGDFCGSYVYVDAKTLIENPQIGYVSIFLGPCINRLDSVCRIHVESLDLDDDEWFMGRKPG